MITTHPHPCCSQRKVLAHTRTHILLLCTLSTRLGQGRISYAQFRESVRRLNNLELSDKAFHAFVRKYDRDNTGYIPYSEVHTAEPHNSWWCRDSCCQCPAHVSNTCTWSSNPTTTAAVQQGCA